jgi:hypothetical protein
VSRAAVPEAVEQARGADVRALRALRATVEVMEQSDVDEERDADRAERLVEEHIRTAWARLRQPS